MMNSERNAYKTVNTFSRTPSPAQIASYIVIALQSVIFYVMVRASMINPVAEIVFTVLYSVSLLATIISAVICSYIDPSDSIMIECKKGNRGKLSKNLQQLLFCQYCQSYVQESARHCRTCDRCVEIFDHHCMWINNCIGSKNYRPFLVMIFSTFINMGVFISAVIYLTTQGKWKQFLGFMATSWAVLGIVGILAILLINLIILHVYLSCKGYTTYQFIMLRREEERKQEMRKMRDEAAKRQRKVMQKYNKINPVSKTSKAIEETNVIKIQNHEQIASFQSNHKTPIKKGEGEGEAKDESQIKDSESLTHLKMTGKVKFQEEVAEFKDGDESNKGSNKDSNQDVIFGNGEESDEAYSMNLGEKDVDRRRQEQDNSGIDQNMGKEVKPSQRLKSESSQKYEKSSQEDSIQISQFFMRNKSLSFLLSNQTAARPKKKYANMSMQMGREGESEQNNTDSIAMVQSMKPVNKGSSAKMKAPAPLQTLLKKGPRVNSIDRKSGDSLPRDPNSKKT